MSHAVEDAPWSIHRTKFRPFIPVKGDFDEDVVVCGNDRPAFNLKGELDVRVSVAHSCELLQLLF